MKRSWRANWRWRRLLQGPYSAGRSVTRATDEGDTVDPASLDDDTLYMFDDIADAVEGEVYRHYSGRGMYGDACIGIVCSDEVKCIEEAAERGIRGAKTDGMGRSTIVYWPRYRDPAAPRGGDDDATLQRQADEDTN